MLRREGGAGSERESGQGPSWVLGEAREEGPQSNPASTHHSGNRHQPPTLTLQRVLSQPLLKPLKEFTLQARNLGPHSCSRPSLPQA